MMGDFAERASANGCLPEWNSLPLSAHQEKGVLSAWF
jgi:hypothetical protein